MSFLPKRNPCACCPPIPVKLPMNAPIAVGFGIACVTRNGKLIWEETNKTRRPHTVQWAERKARKSRGDWRIILHGPLHGETYQRQGKNNWICIEQNRGFA